jgi:hypothetical protein
VGKPGQLQSKTFIQVDDEVVFCMLEELWEQRVRFSFLWAEVTSVHPSLAEMAGAWVCEKAKNRKGQVFLCRKTEAFHTLKTLGREEK